MKTKNVLLCILAGIIIAAIAVFATILAIGDYVSVTEYNYVQTDLKLTAADLKLATSQRDNAIAEIETLQSSIKTLNIELSNLKAIYPPRNFNNADELRLWRYKTGIIGSGTDWVSAVMELQRIGIKDGFILSLDLDQYEDSWGLSLNAVAGNDVYSIYPDELTITPYTTLR
jgi:hypothetical protein